MVFQKGHSQSNTGRTHFKKGHQMSKEIRIEISKTMKGRKPWNTGKSYPSQSERMKNYWENPKYRANQMEKHRLNPLRYWLGRKRPEIRQWLGTEEIMKKAIKGVLKRPTKLENYLSDLIRKENLPYTYVGNGKFLIGYKNPDFVNINGEKLCIEVRPRQTCQFWSKCSPKEYEVKRSIHFAKYGWKCIFLWAKGNKFEKSDSEIIALLK